MLPTKVKLAEMLKAIGMDAFESSEKCMSVDVVLCVNDDNTWRLVYGDAVFTEPPACYEGIANVQRGMDSLEYDSSAQYMLNEVAAQRDGLSFAQELLD